MKSKTIQVRTRMAPSPTGEYHIGHIRTILYNWAFAKKHNGKFIIRIEDTDRARYVEGAVDRILDVISSYGLSWDEGPKVGGPHEPYLQSQRLDIYKNYVQELLEKKSAYYCFCTEERLSKMREEQKAKGTISTKYDRFCLRLSESEVAKKLEAKTPFVIRMKVPDNETITFDDLVSGKISVSSSDIDDQVLIKSDGFPTYHFAVVVDDHLMKITHVMRGNDWIPSTPKHILLYKSFEWEMPKFAHIPNLKELGADKKLSKRFGAVSAKEFLDEGYLPEALLNFLMFLGWNPGTAKELYTLEEFIKDFSIEKIHKTDLVSFDRNKLLWMNGEYIKRLTDEEFAKRIKPFAYPDVGHETLLKLAPLTKDRIKKLSEFRALTDFIFEMKEPLRVTAHYSRHISAATIVLSNINDWNKESVDNALSEAVSQKGFETGDFFMDLRGTIAGSKVTPPINDSILIIGKEETLRRLKKAT